MVRPEMADGMPSRSSGKATPTSPGKPRSRDKVFGDLKNEFPNLPDAVITETLETFYRKVSEDRLGLHRTNGLTGRIIDTPKCLEDP
jgi:hypothetical protein